jgi:nardilysin
MQQHATLEAAVMMMEEPVFDTLRTQEQLGYSVSITLRNTHGVLGISVTVNTQATKFTADHVDRRIEAFFETFLQDSLTEEKVAEAVAALVKLKLRADVTLEEEVSRNWNELTSREFLFCRAEREVAALQAVTAETVRALLTPLLRDRKLSVQVPCIGSSLGCFSWGGSYYMCAV